MLNQNLPKYVAVAEWIKQNIYNNTYKAGEKLISENQLCEKFSISRQTARQAIAILEKEGLVLKKQGSGTYVNHIFSETKIPSKTIGLVTTYLDDYIFPGIISGIEKVLSLNGYNSTLRLTRNKVNTEREQLLSLLKSDIDGLIVEGTKSALPNPNLDIYNQFEQRGIPVVFINSHYAQLNCNYIVVDDELGGELATRHLIENGHQNITGIFKYDDMQGNLRYKGFLTEMYKHNLSVDESAIIWYSTENMEQQFCLENLPQLLKKFKSSTAIVCYNDQIAMKLIQLLASNDLNVPHDLSLVSFDNSSLSQIGVVPLTSITHPGKELGKLAAESILSMINNPHYEMKHTYHPELIIRKSVAKLTK
ncbi:GntR family transcriptional regulator [Turicibacter sanguinis]|uniref:GntR family transcriptional regulator n=1 Tax=Turicibacter sanguinis TaxID=154288 RepID=UPI002943A66F|nr:GntR family transcriptional regulator [Turicibacter sanguinis]